MTLPLPVFLHVKVEKALLWAKVTLKMGKVWTLLSNKTLVNAYQMTRFHNTHQSVEVEWNYMHSHSVLFGGCCYWSIQHTGNFELFFNLLRSGLFVLQLSVAIKNAIHSYTDTDIFMQNFNVFPCIFHFNNW